MTAGILKPLATGIAFRTSMPLDELAELHIPFSEFGFGADPEGELSEAFAQHSGVTLLIGHSGNGKSSVLAYVAQRLADHATHPDRLYLPLFVPVAARQDDLDLPTFGAMAIGDLLATFDDLTDDQAGAFKEATSQEITRQGPNRTLNAKLSAALFGAGIEGGVESRGEVVSITSEPHPLDEFGGLATLAETLRGRKRELIVIVEDTDGWTVGSDDGGGRRAQAFFGQVLAPLTKVDVSVVVAVQRAWTDLGAFHDLRERALKNVELPAFESEEQAAATIRHVIVRRIEWALGERRDAADAVSDETVEKLAAELKREGSIRSILARLRDTLDQFKGEYPERIEVEHLYGSA